MMPAGACAIRSANRLFLITLALTVVLGGALQMWKTWPGLIATELLCILVPTLHFATERPGELRGALRLRWVGWGPLCMGWAVGVGSFPLAAAAGWVGTRALGYQMELPESFWPSGLVETAAYVTGSVALAPVCEELLFRGYILGAYERAGMRPVVAILAVAALFTAFHLSPSRAPVVGVLAIAITYVGWRTGSVWPPIAAHFGANLTAALLVLFRREAITGLSPRVLVEVGLPATVVAALLLWRMPGGVGAAVKGAIPKERGQWRPLWVAAAVVAVFAAIEVAAYRLR